ncbi:hypothetical protein N7470_005188 [Penicillium chermesinum]|nr:hypothetical protein N7470_005188 [Penicillium chermesinum]
MTYPTLHDVPFRSTVGMRLQQGPAPRAPSKGAEEGPVFTPSNGPPLLLGISVPLFRYPATYPLELLRLVFSPGAGTCVPQEQSRLVFPSENLKDLLLDGSNPGH